MRLACRFVCSAFLLASACVAADVTLVRKGVPRATIVVTAGTMADNVQLPHDATPEAKKAEEDRQLLRDSVRDLSDYIAKISGGTLAVVAPGTDTVVGLPIRVGQPGVDLYGPPQASMQGGQGWRVVVRKDGIGIIGESALGTSYAVYEILHRLGCRWYMPSDLGEYVPHSPTVQLPTMDVSDVPDTMYRNIWYADPAFKRRNRQGGVYLACAHNLENLVTEEQRAQHPEWRAVINGKPHRHRVKWSRQDVADAIAANALAYVEKTGRSAVSLSPGDGIGWDEEEDPKVDAGDWDDAASVVSKTDRLILLCNRVAEQVTQTHPDVLFGMLAYVDYTRPPVREKVHPNVIPQIAPITYNRAHPMTAEGHPNGKQLLDIVEGWGKVTPRVSHYWYAYNLAEVYAPNPFITKWSTDVPICLTNNCKFWMPETLPNFETTMPALNIGMRLSWDARQDPAAIVSELMQNFYGAAAEPMVRYWHHIDRAWVDTPEYSGCAFGYLRRFTPEVMEEARSHMDAALEACQTVTEHRRVEIANESLRLFELFMQIRRNWAERRFHDLDKQSEAWRGSARHLMSKYKAQYCFGMPLVARYFDHFFLKTYKDAARIVREGVLLTAAARQWKYMPDADGKAEELGWHQVDFDDGEWKTTDTAVETWSSIGHHNYMGAMAYRATIRLVGAPEGKKLYLWIAATDGSAKVFVNGTHVPFTNTDGETDDAFSGYCEPASFDITGVASPGKPNQVTVLCERTFLNELGTGGIMGPVVVYREL